MTFTFHLSPTLCPPTAGCTLHQCLPLCSVYCFPVLGGSFLLCYVVLSSSAWSSLDLFPLFGCHSVQRLDHLLSIVLAICPANFHFCFGVYLITSIIFVLFLISEHGTLSCSFKFNIFISIALSIVLCLSVAYQESMSGVTEF